MPEITFAAAAVAWLASMSLYDDPDVSCPDVVYAYVSHLTSPTPARRPSPILRDGEDGPPRVSRDGSTLLVPESLAAHADRLRTAIANHLDEVRAKGSEAYVARMAALLRDLNLERLALYKDSRFTLMVLEMLVRMGCENGPLKAPPAHLTCITEYLAATEGLCESVGPGHSVQLIHESLAHEQRVRSLRSEITLLHDENKRLQAEIERLRSVQSRLGQHDAAELSQWDVRLLEEVVRRVQKGPSVLFGRR